MKKIAILTITITLLFTVFGCNNEVEQAPSYFYNMDDFRTFIRTSSRDKEDYIDLRAPYILPKYEILDSDFFDIDLIFSDQKDFLDSLDYIIVYNDDEFSPYCYSFQNGQVTITITPDKETISSKNIVEYHNEIEKKSSQKTSFKDLSLNEARTVKLNSNEQIQQSIGDYVVSYKTHHNENSFYGYAFNTHIDNFYISINVTSLYTNSNYDELISNPINSQLKPFFTESTERTSAFMSLVDAVENREDRRD